MNAPATFEHGGKQYVVALSAGNLLIGSAKGDSVWLFGLDGTLPPAAGATRKAARRPWRRRRHAGIVDRPSARPAARLALVGRGSVQDGKRGLLTARTAWAGTAAARRSIRSRILLVMAMVTDGRGSMPPLSGLLTPEQMRAVAAYVTKRFVQVATKK